MDRAKGRLVEVEFDVRTPTADLTAHVVSALARGLPDLGSEAGEGFLRIVANGPSGSQAPLDGPTLAVNGALRLFTERGLHPTYWAACDPQELVANFLTDPPKDTVYLVASKCHPKVFDALRERQVIVWHIDDYETWDLVKDRDPVPTACSITLTVFNVMERLGFDRFETWGWDGCRFDGRENAVQQQNSGDRKTVIVGDKQFDTSATWALEAQDAVRKLPGYRVDVKGGGMIGAILEYMEVPLAA